MLQRLVTSVTDALTCVNAGTLMAHQGTGAVGPRASRHRGNLTAPQSEAGPATGTVPKKGTAGLPQPRSGSAAPQQRTSARPYTTVEQEKAVLDLVRRALALDETELRDLRAQHGPGADAVDELARFYELKTYGGAKPDTIQLTPRSSSGRSRATPSSSWSSPAWRRERRRSPYRSSWSR